MRRGYQKLTAFLIGFPLFVFAFGACGNAAFQSDMEDFRFYGLLTLAGLMLWLWGMFAP